jgi:hypothetical protein
MALKLEAISVKNATQIDKEAREDRHYAVAIQLGCRTRWRQYGGGRWESNPAKDMPGLKAYKHVPAVHKVSPVDGATVNGLISEHNKFLAANQASDKIEGDVGRSLLVIGFEETAPPALRASALPFDIEALVTKIAEASATAAVTAMMNVMKPSGK